MIELVPWTDRASVEPLLAAAGHAEGLPGWFDALAATTLSVNERSAIATVGRAALPVAIGPYGLRALTAPYTTCYVPALPDVDDAYRLGRGLRAVADGVVRLDAVDPSDPGTAAFLKGLGTSFAVATYQGFANWSEPVSGFAGYWQRRPSRLKATVRRKLAAADAAFTYVRREFEAALGAYEAIQGASWKGPEPHPEFLAAMVRRLPGVVRMGLLAIGGRPVAAQIWLVHGGRATIVKLVHREDAAAMSPGTLLTYRMIETCLNEEAVDVLDFGRGDDPYKRDWMATRANRLGVVAADWRRGRGLKAIATDVLPTLAGRAWRRHCGVNRPGSSAAEVGEALARHEDRGRVNAAEASS